MNIEIQQDGARRKMTVDGEMTIYTAAELKQRMVEHLAGSESLELDLSRVTEMDSAGYQVLLMARNEAQRADIDLAISHHSESVFEVLELFGVQSQFSDAVVIPAEWGRS
jgi:anti-anti-sigma factor